MFSHVQKIMDTCEKQVNASFAVVKAGAGKTLATCTALQALYRELGAGEDRAVLLKKCKAGLRKKSGIDGTIDKHLMAYINSFNPVSEIVVPDASPASAPIADANGSSSSASAAASSSASADASA